MAKLVFEQIDDVRAAHPYLFVYLLEDQQTFQVVINFPWQASPTILQVNSANSAVDISIIFDGYVIEPVQ